MEGARHWLTACHSLERQQPRCQGSADHDNDKAYYNDDQAKDYDVRVEPGVAGVAHALSIAHYRSRGNDVAWQNIMIDSVSGLLYAHAKREREPRTWKT